MSHDDDGFVSFQIRLRDVAFTTSRADLEAVRYDLRALGLTDLEIEQVFRKTRETLLTPEVAGNAASAGVENAKRGFPAKEIRTEGPLCGHGVPTLKRTSKGKDWWTCQAKDARGTFLWKNKEGCEWIPVEG